MTRHLWFMMAMMAAMLLLARGAIAADDAPAAPAAAPSLIFNGDFETDANADGVPDGWGKPSDNVQYPDENGNHYLRLKVTEAGKMVLVYRKLNVPEGAKAMELTFKVRYQNIEVGKQPWFDGRIMMNFKDADGKVVKPAPSPPYFRKTHEEWMERTVKFRVPEGAKMLEIMPCLFQAAAGTLDFDDLKLVVIDESQLSSAAVGAPIAFAMPAAAVAVVAVGAPDAADAVDDKAEAREKRIDQQLADQLQQTGNLVFNGDFEKANKTGDWAEGWGSKPADQKLQWLEEGGDHFMRITSQEPGSIAMLYRIVLLPRGVGGLNISMRYRTSGVKNGSKMPGDARAIFHFIGGQRGGVLEQGPKPGHDPRALGFSSKADEWTVTTQQCLVPQGATKLQMMSGLWFAKAGAVDVTDIHITPMTDADVADMKARIAAAEKEKNEHQALIDSYLAQPAKTVQLKVVGNQVVTVDGEKPIWLQGLSVDSMQWCMGENILWSIHVAIDEWHANVIRLAVSDKFWFGHGKGQPEKDGAEKYRKLVDQAVELCAAKGAYLVLDLHNFGAPMAKDAEFWKDAAERYKNNPAVLFELFNEPHGISWKLWRDGGDLNKDKHQDVNPTENTEKQAGEQSIGMQALIDVVRSTGAKNIVLCGGTDWSGSLSGITEGYTLDQKDGDGLIYVCHVYPWKKEWKKNFIDIAEKYPVILTEVGAINKWSDFSFIGPSQRYPLEGWAEDMIAAIQKYKLHWTAFSFHPRCGPMIIQDWNYTPTPYWGVYVKEALAGKQFELKEVR